MAGNPFRRSMAVAHPIDAELNPSTTADVLTTPQKRTKTKRVKIESPPHAAHSHGERRLSASDSAARAPSPPPPQRSDSDDEAAASDSTATADSDLDQATLNTRRNSGSLPRPTTDNMAGRTKAPYNPFARTLATKEASFGLQQNHDQSEKERQKPVMDVDAFKNILLTGSATPQASSISGAGERSASATRGPHDSGSSTETSSIFDSAYTLHPESPRVDHYDFHSTSDSDDDDDNDVQYENERTNLMGEGRLDDLPPPAPPKPKSTRGPQTVSFADFDQSIPPDFQAPVGRGTPPLNTQHRGILRPTIQRSASDLNKPLPPPPAVRQPSDTPSPPVVPEKDVPQSQQHLPEPTLTHEDDFSTPKKVPPPPPTSRRQAATPGRPRSVSNLSAQESISDRPDPEDPGNTPPPLPVKADEPSSMKQSHPPPPPPARKVHPVAPSPVSTDVPTHAPTEVKPLVPPPPPRRHPSTSGSMRTASPASSLRKEFSTLPPSGTNAPPPPPPRRAAGGGNSSQRSSIDGRPSSLRKFSGIENQRRASKQSIDSAGSEQAAVSPSTEAAKRDVLADMTAFQAEIDALRLQARAAK